MPERPEPPKPTAPPPEPAVPKWLASIRRQRLSRRTLATAIALAKARGMRPLR